jgi:IS30 family transposase
MSENANERFAVAIERISKVLGALYASQMGDLEQGLKAERLSRCGFSNTEIADLLGTSPNTINVALHKARRQKKMPKRSRSKK